MTDKKCPLCKQAVSENLYEKITGIWKARKIQEKEFKEKQKELIKQRREDKKQLVVKEKKMKSELKSKETKIKERADKKIALTTKSTERRVRLEANKEAKIKVKAEVEKKVKTAGIKTQKDLFRANQTIAATRNQMSTVQKQNLKQQERIKNLEIQLKNKTTPQLEGLLYEDKLVEALQKDFPEDKLEHTGKGGDVLQHVIFDKKTTGLIVYECKKVNNWQNAHVEQAFRARLQRKADFAILVTNATKRGTVGFFIQRGVIVINPGGVLTIAGIFRDRILEMAQLKLTQVEKNKAIEKTLQYLQSAEFKNSIEVVIRNTISMYDDLKKECKDHLNLWHKRYNLLKNIYGNSVQVQTKTIALISGKIDTEEKVLDVKPFPAIPDLTQL